MDRILEEPNSRSLISHLSIVEFESAGWRQARHPARASAVPIRQYGSFNPGTGVGGAGEHWAPSPIVSSARILNCARFCARSMAHACRKIRQFKTGRDAGLSGAQYVFERDPKSEMTKLSTRDCGNHLPEALARLG